MAIDNTVAPVANDKRTLSREDIALFCQKRSEGATVRDLANHFDIPLTQAYYILLGKKYADLLPEGYQYVAYPKTVNASFPNGRKALFSKEDVARMCELHSKGCSLSQIAKQFNTSHNTIWDVLTGKSYKGFLPEWYVYQFARQKFLDKRSVKTVKKPVKHQTPSNRFDELIANTQKEFDRIVREALAQ